MNIGFIGLGHMGLPMALNLHRAGFNLSVYDRADSALKTAAAAGLKVVNDLASVVADQDGVITMLPAGAHVYSAYLAEDGILAHASGKALLIDCSTIDVETARKVHSAAEKKGLAMLDAPVSGGTAGAEAGRLTFMVGGDASTLAKAQPLFEVMGSQTFHAGAAGNGQAAKICNNMVLGITMIATSEAFHLGEKLGLAPEALFNIMNHASGQNWSLSQYCPKPGLVATSPANRGYQPGFTAAMMSKDLRLAQQAANSVGAATPLGAQAEALYALFNQNGGEALDFSAIIQFFK